MRRAAGLLLGCVVALPSSAQAAGEQDREAALAGLTAQDYQESVVPLTTNIIQLSPNIIAFDRNITPFETTAAEGESTTITLSSDILFAFDEATVSEEAAERIVELLAKVPEGASVEVGGHTDSVSDESYNRELSQRRAQAVADVLAEARPDLTLEVEGFGESQPVADNTSDGKDNPAGRALNRRVEVRYQG